MADEPFRPGPDSRPNPETPRSEPEILPPTRPGAPLGDERAGRRGPRMDQLRIPAHRNAPYQPAAPVHMGADRVEPARADRRNHADRAPHHRRSRRAIVRRGVAAAGFAALGSLWTAGFQPAWGPTEKNASGTAADKNAGRKPAAQNKPPASGARRRVLMSV